jgi:septum formation protein
MKLSKKIILASGSPRRKQIMSDAGFEFDVEVIPTDEAFDPSMNPYEVPIYLSEKKVSQFRVYDKNYIVIASDTVVIVENQILNKPRTREEAIVMLSLLNHKVHTVVTGVSIKIGNQINSFSDSTSVCFTKLSRDEIEYYVDQYQPFDKAGAYGVQEFIGMIGIERIEGSFYTVMGLPIHKIFQELKTYIRY